MQTDPKEVEKGKKAYLEYLEHTFLETLTVEQKELFKHYFENREYLKDKGYSEDQIGFSFFNSSYIK